jgi:putative ABC transport system permease protein
VSGGGLDALAHTPSGVLVSEEVAADYEVQVGDTLPVTIYPDDLDLSQKLNLKVVGVYRAFAPSDPISEMVLSAATLLPPVPPPDYYLVRIAPGADPDAIAAKVRQGNSSAASPR